MKGYRLKSAREMWGRRSLPQAAKLLNIDIELLKHWEKGDIEPSDDEIELCAKAYKVDKDWLKTGCVPSVLSGVNIIHITSQLLNKLKPNTFQTYLR
jgi:transcriptional regulator with XRE-family HTH domain